MVYPHFLIFSLNEEQRLEKTLLLLSSDTLAPVCSDPARLTQACKLSLIITRNQPLPAAVLIGLVETGAADERGFDLGYEGWPNVAADLFGTRISGDDILELEGVLGVQEILREGREWQLRDNAESMARLVPIAEECLGLGQSFGHEKFEDALKEVRVAGALQDLSIAIPQFLALVDLEVSSDEDIKERVEQLWAKFYRSADPGRDEESDAECASQGRNDEYVRKFLKH
jgi:hypothetical protein